MSYQDATNEEIHRQTEANEQQAPSPTELVVFLPWIIKQLELDIELVVHTSVIEDYVSIVASDRTSKYSALKAKSRPRMPSSDILKDTDANKTTDGTPQEASDFVIPEGNNKLFINIGYEHQNVAALKFEKNRVVPPEIMKILALVVHFHKTLTAVTINRGLNAHVLYELSKLLCLSKITDLCLDNCFVEEGNYYVLLEQQNCLKTLSLSKCRIDDTVVSLMASLLAFPHPGSSTLIALNLSTNRISDIGVKSIAVALRTNDKLAYLNLADNMIFDEGFECILNNLLSFPLTDEEVTTLRATRLTYTMKRRDAIENYIRELKTDAGKPVKKPKVNTLGSRKSKVFEKESMMSMMIENVDKPSMSNAIVYERAAAMAAVSLGSFKGPFRDDNIFEKDGLLFSKGNHSLHYLNIAYNNLSYISLRRLLEVLSYQTNADRRPVGLVNVNVEGNPLPVTCEELVEIGNILEAGLRKQQGRWSTLGRGMKKKSGMASTPVLFKKK